MIIKKEVIFKSSIERVWDVLTNPEQTKHYMFGCEVLSDWSLGSPIVWNGKTENGEIITYVQGTITKYIDKQEVSFTMFDPNIGIQDIPENYISLTYKISKTGNNTKLIILQGDFYGTENAQKRFEESQKGWDMVIPLLQKMI